jgi:hypothetical protein
MENDVTENGLSRDEFEQINDLGVVQEVHISGGLWDRLRDEIWTRGMGELPLEGVAHIDQDRSDVRIYLLAVRHDAIPIAGVTRRK